MNGRGERALITGASTGLGREFAFLAAADGRDLVLTARDLDRLNEVAEHARRRFGVDADVIGCDLSRPGAARELYDEVRRRELSVDVLINNAGFGNFGYFARSRLETVEAMIETNVTALTLVTRLFIDEMLTRERGMILNIASLAAFTPGPLMAVYHASKAYVLAFSEAIAEELDDSGVTVTALVPGITRTEFQRRAGISEAKVGAGAMGAAEVAAQGYRAMIAGRRVHVAGTKNQVLGFLAHHTPHAVATRVAHRLQRQLLP
jgi:uncharacterized protein